MATDAARDSGCIKNDINAWLEPFGFLFGPDPASNPSVGGMASTRGSGLSTMMYGTTAENVLSMLVVTAEGKLIRTRQCTRKSSTGYELNQLYMGSEGTLGVICELVVKVYPIMPVRTGALIRFATVGDAARAVIKIVQSGPKAVCRCELLNADGIEATNKMFKTDLVKEPTIFMEFRGQTANACKLDSDKCVEIALVYGATYEMQTEDAAEMDQMWAARRGCYIAAGKVREQKGDSVYLSDTCVPISKLAASVEETERDFVKNGLAPVICAHIADGNFHCCVPYQPKDLKEKAKVVELEHELIRRALRLGGTVSGEHGVGVGKMEHIIEEHGEVHVDIQRRIKRALDPRNIMNPSSMFTIDGSPVPKQAHQ